MSLKIYFFVEEIQYAQNELLHEVNQVIGTDEEKELLTKMDNRDSSLEENFNEIMKDFLLQKRYSPTNQLLYLLGFIKFFSQEA